MKEISGFNREFFIGNRRKLESSFGGEAMIVLTANALMEKGVDSTYPFSQDSNFWYLTGLDDPEIILVIDGNKESLILPKRSIANVVFDGAIDVDRIREQSGIAKVFEHEKGMSWLKRKVKKAKFIATLNPPAAYDEHVNAYTNPAKRQLVSDLLNMNSEIQFIDLSNNLSALRLIKQTQEIDTMRTASKNTVKVFKNIYSKIDKFKTESDIQKELEIQMIKSEYRHAYSPIIAGGKNANVLHFQGSGDGAVDKLVLLDIGIEELGYASDVTRTYFDQSNERYKQVHNALLDVYDFACSLVLPGMTMLNIEQRTRQFMGEKLRELGLIDIINQQEIAKFFPHALGHFVGIDVHDGRDPEAQLQAGMVITIEPGIYINDEEFGMRHEDTLLITKHGYDNLTEKVPKIDNRQDRVENE